MGAVLGYGRLNLGLLAIREVSASKGQGWSRSDLLACAEPMRRGADVIQLRTTPCKGWKTQRWARSGGRTMVRGLWPAINEWAGRPTATARANSSDKISRATRKEFELRREPTALRLLILRIAAFHSRRENKSSSILHESGGTESKSSQ